MLTIIPSVQAVDELFLRLSEQHDGSCERAIASAIEIALGKHRNSNIRRHASTIERLSRRTARSPSRYGLLVRTREADLAGADIATMLRDGAGLEKMLPPFAAAHRAAADDSVIVATDWLGFRQLYWWRGEDVAASRRAPARCRCWRGRVRLDRTRRPGHDRLADRRSGHRSRAFCVPAATIAELADGRSATPALRARSLTARRTGANASTTRSTRWRKSSVASVALPGGASRHRPAAHGGRRSTRASSWVRFRRTRRRGLGALTLGEESHPDVVIAGSPGSAVRHASRGSPPGRTRADADRGARARTGGSTGPGVPGEPRWHWRPCCSSRRTRTRAPAVRPWRRGCARGSTTRASRQARRRRRDSSSDWRNGGSSPTRRWSTTPGYDVPRRGPRGDAWHPRTLFEPGDWLRATDAFYLYHRMHRWAAVHGTVAAVRRRAVNPMFDRRFIDSPSRSRLPTRRIRCCWSADVEASIRNWPRYPIDSGLVPSRLGTRDFRTRVAIARVMGRRMPIKAGAEADPRPTAPARRSECRRVGRGPLAHVTVVVSGAVRPADAESTLG